MKRTVKNTRSNDMEQPLDAWKMFIITKTMSVDELRTESANPENSIDERQAMRLELAKRSGK